MRIGEIAAQSGLSAHTIRWYERIGLMPRVPRDAARHRDYDPAVLTWIEFLGRLKSTGMPVREMVRYAALRDQGPATSAERRALLERHRDRVRAHLAELESSLAALDAKIAFYVTSEPEDRAHDR